MPKRIANDQAQANNIFAHPINMILFESDIFGQISFNLLWNLICFFKIKTMDTSKRKIQSLQVERNEAALIQYTVFPSCNAKA